MKKSVLFLINLYRQISFIFPRRCIYIPTCSEYAKEAFTQHSFLKAAKLSLLRIIRCNPLAKGGVDPVEQCKSKISQ